ncbi:MAG TPA: T9SS type A sorting domain-containing protein [Ignavibacteriaceae bacterium]|nr:T9SS type A sorting domain-containing protein [Ignavibacteriaceae bacterium]
MKKILLLLFVCGFILQSEAYDKKSLVERFTNCSCGPCAQLNNSWYNATTANLINSGLMTHIVYNGDWPSPGECDPMHLLNQANNNSRIAYYGVNAVPWIEINGTTFNTGGGSTGFTNTINSGNSQFAPFKIILTPERFSNNVIDVGVKIIRDPSDVTTFGNIKLQVALTEKNVTVTGNPCCSNGETQFFSICRDLLPDAQGTTFTIPAPGDSVELNLQYIPTADFIAAVNFDSLRVVAFIQDKNNQQVFQSTMTDVIPSDRVNAAFQVDEYMGASPFTVTFQDFSTATASSSIISWEWDLDSDGTIDSNDPEPTWTYSAEQTYTVTLTVSDGTESHTRILEDYIIVLGSSSNILVVNGIAYVTYPAEMLNFYSSSACFGNHQVDVWDLFGDQGFDYSANPNILQVNLFNRDIPNSILKLYSKVIWIGNNFSGDLAFFNNQQVLDYVGIGGNFLLATRMANLFFSSELKNYCGIQSFTGDMTATQLIALDPNLIDVPALSGHTYVHYPTLSPGSEATPIFDDNLATGYIAGFRIKKTDEGDFIFIAGRPYRYDNSASNTNYNYIIDNWMTGVIVGAENDDPANVVNEYRLYQNYPNPFNPATQISYSIPNSELVTLKIYDVLGKEIHTLVNEVQSANTYTITFDAGKLSSGIYFYKLKAGNFAETRKMILLR